jgi:phospholipid transport system substrate-binding protein
VQNDLSDQQIVKKKTTEEMYLYIKQMLMPHLDVRLMAAMALGPKWRVATEEQRTEFIDEFGILLTRTYATAIEKVSDYHIEVSPLRDEDWASKKSVMISGEMGQKSTNKTSKVVYYMRRKDDTWVIYDLAVEGVSFIKNFNEQFAEYQSMEELLKKLRQVNADAKTKPLSELIPPTVAKQAS